MMVDFLNVIDNDDIFICYDIFHTENGATEKRIYARMYIITLNCLKKQNININLCLSTQPY
jgi:hypothetical protein